MAGVKMSGDALLAGGRRDEGGGWYQKDDSSLPSRNCWACVCSWRHVVPLLWCCRMVLCHGFKCAFTLAHGAAGVGSMGVPSLLVAGGFAPQRLLYGAVAFVWLRTAGLSSATACGNIFFCWRLLRPPRRCSCLLPGGIRCPVPTLPSSCRGAALSLPNDALSLTPATGRENLPALAPRGRTPPDAT